MLNLTAASEPFTRLHVLPAAHAIVSWNTPEAMATLEVSVHTADGRRSRPLPYVAFEPGRRASLDGFDNVAKIETDIVRSDGDIVALDVRANRPLVRVAASTPPGEPPRSAPPAKEAARELDVPERSQYEGAFPAERGWCAPAATAMLTATWGIDATVPEVAAGLFDAAYNGTGNWTFAVAYAGACGLAGAAAYLRDLVNLEVLIAAGLPAAVSIAWENGALPGAPLERSAGHIVVVRGFDARGDVIVNDPAQPAVRHVYARAPFADAWLGHGGVALLVAPPDRVDDLLRGANA